MVQISDVAALLAGTWSNDNVIIRQNDATASFWRTDYAIITSCVRWVDMYFYVNRCIAKIQRHAGVHTVCIYVACCEIQCNVNKYNLQMV